MKHIVTLSGDIGGGKSSVARILSASLAFPVISAGGIQREIAASMGLTTLELNRHSAKDRSIDDRIDAHTKMLGETRDHIIVDSRLAWHFIPPAFKVFLSVDPQVGAERVFEASRANEKNPTLADTVENNRTRTQLESTRFQALYGITLRDYRNYDLVVDTSFAPAEVVAAKIQAGYEARVAGRPFAHAWMCPARLARMTRTPDASAAGPITLAVRDGQFTLAGGLDAVAACATQQQLVAVEVLFEPTAGVKAAGS